eukprot:m.416397 g.416397  ORF g.416397 m.416397 type:complete len:246 (-) comp29969_c0_seq1:137-874(-)
MEPHAKVKAGHSMRYFSDADQEMSKLQKRAVKDITDDGEGTAASLEEAFSRLLEGRDTSSKYVHSNDIWAWLSTNRVVLAKPARAWLTPKEETEDGGSITVDLHGMRRWTGQSFVVFMICDALGSPAESSRSSLTFITGRGKSSKALPVLFSDMIALFRGLKCPFTMPNPGRFQVDLTADFRAAWNAAFFSRRMSTIGASGQQTRIMSIPSDVSEYHWNTAKQPGVDRENGRHRDKRKQAVRNAK